MAGRKRTREQNAAIYQRRKAKAITEGYKGYGQKRYQQSRQREFERTTTEGQHNRDRIRDLLRGFYPDEMFDSSGWLDRDETDKEIKRALRAIERRHGVSFDDAYINSILFDEATRWANFRAMYERMMGWAA